MKPAQQIRRARGRKGAVMLESALVTLTLVGMIVFVMDIGRVLLTEQFITERARTAVRNASVNSWDATTVANYLVYNSTTAPAKQNGFYAAGFMGLLPSQVSFSALGTSGTPDYRLQVTVSGVPLFILVPGMSHSYTAPAVTVTTPAQSLGATN